MAVSVLEAALKLVVVSLPDGPAHAEVRNSAQEMLKEIEDKTNGL
jgi:hypothetical protein